MWEKRDFGSKVVKAMDDLRLNLGEEVDLKEGVSLFLKTEQGMLVELTLDKFDEVTRLWLTDDAEFQVSRNSTFWVKKSKPVGEEILPEEKEQHVLVLHCGGPFSSVGKSIVRKCRHSLQVPFAIGREELTLSMSKHGWIMSVVTSTDAPVPANDVLCPTCAKSIYGQRMYETALRRMKQEVKKRMEFKMPSLLRGSELVADEKEGGDS